MKRPEEERLFILRQLRESFVLDKRRRRLYNKKYHKNLIYTATWIVRAIYVIAFFVAAIFHTKSGNVRDEVIVGLEIKSGRMIPERGVSEGTVIHFRTYSGKYASELKKHSPPALTLGDTVNRAQYFLETHLFRKAGLAH